jgi:DnaJ family protein C protein 3
MIEIPHKLCIHRKTYVFISQLGEGEESLNEVRECLRLDPEHKECYPFYKKVKKVAKFLIASQEAQNTQDWAECISAAQKVLKNEPTVML